MKRKSDDSPRSVAIEISSLESEGPSRKRNEKKKTGRKNNEDKKKNTSDDPPEGVLISASAGPSSNNHRRVRRKHEVVDLTTPIKDDDDVVLVSEVQGDFPELVAVRGPENDQSTHNNAKRNKSYSRRVQEKDKEKAQEQPRIVEKQFQCSICWDSEKNLCCTPCGHIFCVGCIERAIHVKKVCPQCRKPCTTRQLRRLFF